MLNTATSTAMAPNGSRKKFRNVDSPFSMFAAQAVEDHQVVGQHRQTHLGIRTPLPASRQLPQPSVCFHVGVGQLHRLLPQLVRLPERQRLVLFLRYFADLPYEAIADALEISPGTVAATLNAAHRSLRRRLQEVEE